MLRYRDKLEEMPLYDVVERPWKIKVNANECNMNLPPLVEERVMTRLSRVAFNRYPNEEPVALREQIAARYGLQTENIMLGNGSSEILEKLFHAFGGHGRKVVYTQPSFSMYRIFAKAAESDAVPFDLREDFGLDAEAFVKTVNESGAALAVMCNPNNPTGNLTPLADIEYIAKNVDCAFVVDEAYVEFAGEAASAIPLLKKYPNLIIARTFSKAFGLASARVGYMLAAQDIVDTVSKAVMPYSLNVLSAVTADIVYQMRDEYAPRVAQAIAERTRMEERLQTLEGVTVYPSKTNFVLVHYDGAPALNEALEAQGIGLRSFGQAPRLTNCLRISVGTREENDIVFKAIADFVGGR